MPERLYGVDGLGEGHRGTHAVPRAEGRPGPRLKGLAGLRAADPSEFAWWEIPPRLRCWEGVVGRSCWGLGHSPTAGDSGLGKQVHWEPLHWEGRTWWAR